MEQKSPLPNIPEHSEIPVSPPVNSSSLKKTFLVVLLVILLVTLSSLGTYFFIKSQTASPTPVVFPTPTLSASLIPSTADEMTGWKTYTNSKYGFSFKYPSEFEYLAEDEVFTSDDFKGVIMLQNFPISKRPNYSDNATFQMLIYMKKDNGELVDNKLTITNAGTAASTKIAKNGNIYLIDFTLNKTGNTGIFDQILSTFKFN